MNDEPFGRQPKKVTVRVDGEVEDVLYWSRHFKRAAEFKGDQVQTVMGDSNGTVFVIYPRAVND